LERGGRGLLTQPLTAYEYEKLWLETELGAIQCCTMFTVSFSSAYIKDTEHRQPAEPNFRAANGYKNRRQFHRGKRSLS